MEIGHCLRSLYESIKDVCIMKRFQQIGIILFLLIGSSITSFSQIIDAPPRDGIFDKSAIMELQAIPYIYLREADIVWTKRIWRTIDMREKINLPYYFPTKPQGTWKSFIDVVMDALREGSLTAYSSTNEEFLYPISYDELMNRLEAPELKTLRDENGVEYDSLISRIFYSSDVKKLVIKEDWFFDKQRSIFEVRIIGISPLMESYVPGGGGQKRADEQLFWIYFPEAREVLAHAEIFNMKNGSAGRLSFDDAFTKRIFSSYITKTENVYNRRINQYATGVDALLESERAKNQIFEFEEGLWEY
ncbi:gliding motility protein GldN [Bacteroidota bacterium]